MNLEVWLLVRDWLWSEPAALLAILGSLQLMLVYKLSTRMRRIEFRHDALIRRTTSNAGDISRLRRNTDTDIEAMVKQEFKKQRRR